MTRRRCVAALAAICIASATWSCGPKRVPTPAPATGDQVVLLPDPETSAVGRAVVSNPAGSVDLAGARQSTTIPRGQAPSAVVVLSEDDVRSVFGDVLAALPPAATHFTLYYKFDSDDLTDDSRALLPQVLQAVKDRPAPEVVVVGHTDTTGTAANNYALGLRRAASVRTLLVEAGLDASFIEVTSHGEADPLVPTADEVAEPRNRRVEITVR